MNIDAIRNGIVIDHITAGRGMEIYRLLHLDSLDCSVAIIKNVTSAKMGKKDIIKIDADLPLDMDILGYVDPGITVDIIRNGELAEKRRMDLPERLTNVIFCKNPRCITSTGAGIASRIPPLRQRGARLPLSVLRNQGEDRGIIKLMFIRRGGAVPAGRAREARAGRRFAPGSRAVPRLPRIPQ